MRGRGGSSQAAAPGSDVHPLRSAVRGRGGRHVEGAELMGEGIEDARHEFGEREERAMNSRTRPGRVPAHVEAMGDDGSVLADVIAGRPIYPDPEEEDTRTRVIPSKRLFD